MSKTLNKFVTAFDYVEKTLLVLSGASSGVSLCSFTNVIGTLAGVASASISLVFFISSGIIKMLLKTMERRKK